MHLFSGRRRDVGHGVPPDLRRPDRRQLRHSESAASCSTGLPGQLDGRADRGPAREGPRRAERPVSPHNDGAEIGSMPPAATVDFAARLPAMPCDEAHVRKDDPSATAASASSESSRRAARCWRRWPRASGVGLAARRATPAARILSTFLRRCAARASTCRGRRRSPQSSGSGVRPPALPRTHCSPWRQVGAPVAAALLDSGTFSPIQPARPPSTSPFRPPVTTIVFG